MTGLALSPALAGDHARTEGRFDAKIDEAASFVGPTEERDALFDEAEKMLVADDVGAIFMFHPLTIWLYPLNLKGPYLEPDRSGFFTNIGEYVKNAYFAQME